MERLRPPIAPRAPGRWQIAAVSEIRDETPRARTYRLELPMWMPHLPGQHYDVRLTAPDGYQAQRSYSIASAPSLEGAVELTIDCLADGEVSPYFHEVVEVGDQVEVRGPFAAYFVWRGDEPGPILLAGGGSGVVPLMAMLRHNRDLGSPADMRLVYSVRSPAELFYADELGEETTPAYTREAPEGWTGHTGRIDATMLPEATGTAYVCGSNGFVETATGLLMDLGVPAGRIRTERFGPTG